MNKKSILLAVIIGTALGVFVLHPLWVSIHAFDGEHGEGSWLDFLVVGYRETLSFEDLDHIFYSVLVGIMVSAFVLMIKSRKRN